MRRAERSMAGATRIKSPYAPLTAGEVRGVHRAALEVLETVSMAAPTDRARQVGMVGLGFAARI